MTKVFQLSNCQDYASVNTIFISSLVNVSSSQYERSLGYINEYTNAASKLSEASRYLSVTLQNVLNTTNVENMFSSIQGSLNSNVQKLVEKYSPVNVRLFIVYYYQTFLSNLVINNGTQSEILALNVLYAKNFLKTNVTICMSKYNEDHFKIYEEAVKGFVKLMESTTTTTTSKLDLARNEVKDMIKLVVKSVEKIIANKATARDEFDTFVSF